MKAPSPSHIRATRRIHNDLLFHNDQTAQKGTRVQRLRELIKTQNWGHLAPDEALILEYYPLFILSKKELGLISGPPEHIRVSDPQSCRGPRYRYPEPAKEPIS